MNIKYLFTLFKRNSYLHHDLLTSNEHYPFIFLINFNTFLISRKLSNAKNRIQTSHKAENLQKSNSSVLFGALSPPVDSHEFIEPSKEDIKEEEFHQKKLLKKHSVWYYGHSMYQLIKDNKLKEAIHIFDNGMVNVGARPDKFCFSVLISGCGKAGYTSKAFKLYNQMKQYGINPHISVYTSLFNACSNSPWPSTDGLSRASKLYDYINSHQIILNAKTYHSAIKAFAHCGDTSKAFRVTDDMIKNNVLITTETINFLLQACITDKKSGFRHAVVLWKKFKELRLKPDIYSFNLLIRCIKECEAGLPELTHQLLDVPLDNTLPTLPEHDTRNNEKDIYSSNSSYAISNCEYVPSLLNSSIPSNIISLNTLAKPCDRLGSIGGLNFLLSTMLKNKIKPNIKTCTQLLQVIPSKLSSEKELLKKTYELDILLDTSFCNALIDRRCNRGNIKAAKTGMDLFQKFQIYPDIITFGSLAKTCLKLEDAIELMKNIDDAGFKCNNIIITNLIHCSKMSGDFMYTVELLKYMKNNSFIPDKVMIKTLEEIHKNARNTLLCKDNNTNISSKQLVHVNIFMIEYANWLKKSKLERDDHPWNQFHIV